MLKRLAIAELQPGMVITQITEQNGPVKIRKSGLVTSLDMVSGLAEMGVAEVEIDQAQTVEVEVQPVHQSPTQALLTSANQGKARDVDSELSERFNRSLFLPSARAIPSLWQFYAKRSAIGLAVLVLGIFVGFGMRQVPSLLAQWQPSVASPTEKATDMDAERPVQLPPNADNSAETEVVTAQPEVQIPAVSEQELLSQTNESAAIEQIPVSEVKEPAVPEEDLLAALSPELRERFEQAVAEVDNNPDLVNQDDAALITTSVVKRVDELPAWILTELPRMTFTTHIYASEAQDRWVNVNGIELGEGDWLSDELMIRRIEPQQVVLNYKGHDFSLPALTDW